MTRQFELNWSELPEELREQKIDEFIQGNMQEYKQEYVVNNFEGPDEKNTGEALELIEAKTPDSEVFNDPVTRSNAEGSIEARFPIYF